jgi:hypothetical protein
MAPAPPEPSVLAANRADFVKRIFAVAVSVGFASQLVQQPWIRAGALPTWPETADFLLLCLGLLLVVQSWEGYLRAITSRPLEKVWRFYIDIALVFMYLSLLVISKNRTAFLFLNLVIFLTYVLWDCISFLEFYKRDGYPSRSLSSYFKGLLGPGRRRLTTIIYFGFSLELFLVHYFSRPLLLLPMFVSVLGILIGYRQDKESPSNVIVYAILFVPLGILLVYDLIC